MKQCIIIVGISGSGKSTWSREYVKLNKGWIIVERDLIRQKISEEKNIPFSWQTWKWKWETEVTSIFNHQVDNAIHDPSVNGFIISDTNINLKHRHELIESLKERNVEVNIQYLEISFETACKRDLARPYSVGQSVIARQYQQLINNKETNIVVYTHDPSLPPCFIFDVDGTLAHMHNRGPFEWDKVSDDTIDEALAIIIKALIATQSSGSNIHIIIVSGRDGSCEKETIDWLTDHEIWYTDFFIREAGDTRADTIIKEEIFNQHIRNHYNVLGVFDDRPKVCNMWRHLGLKVFQVGNPYIEF